jgi:hypothetical protein
MQERSKPAKNALIARFWHGLHLRYSSGPQSPCKNRADSIGFTGEKLITGSSLHAICLISLKDDLRVT